MNHSVSQLINSIKNGQLVRKDKVYVPSSKVKKNILEVLKKNGFIKDFTVGNNGRYDVIEIVLSYSGTQGVIKEIEVLSKPGRRLYAGVKDIPVVYNGLGMVILSTPKGIMSDYDAKQLNIGGELLMKIF